MFISTGDMLLSVFFILGLCQYIWLSVVLVRQGLNPSLIRPCLTILMAIWILVWPAYEDGSVIIASLLLFLAPILLSFRQQSPFARHLRLCWQHSANPQQRAPWFTLLLSLFIATLWFYFSPHIGLGMALSICLAWSAAGLVDKFSTRGIIPLSGNLSQTWAGHITLILLSSVVALWSLQLYLEQPWQHFWLPALLASLTFALARLFIPRFPILHRQHDWSLPLAILSMGTLLQLLLQPASSAS